MPSHSFRYPQPQSLFLRKHHLRLLLHQAKIELNDKLTVTFTDASWQDDVDTGRSTGGYIIFKSGGPIDHRCHLPVPVALSTGEAEYLAAAVACTAAQHIRMMNYDLYHLTDKDYVPENTEKYPASNIILDSSAAIAIASSDKDTKRTRHILQRYHFVRQGSALGQHQLGWIGTTDQMADPLTKNGDFKDINSKILADIPELKLHT